MPKPLDWKALSAPDIATFETLAREAYAALPEPFRSHTGNITIRIADLPSDDVVETMELESPFDLLGLFEGVGLAEHAATAATGQMPNMIWLYRRPILDYWSEHTDTLGDIITHVLIHEIGHHFGLSDADMETIEVRADPERTGDHAA